jgi:hypothetical protein
MKFNRDSGLITAESSGRLRAPTRAARPGEARKAGKMSKHISRVDTGIYTTTQQRVSILQIIREGPNGPNSPTRFYDPAIVLDEIETGLKAVLESHGAILTTSPPITDRRGMKSHTIGYLPKVPRPVLGDRKLDRARFDRAVSAMQDLHNVRGSIRIASAPSASLFGIRLGQAVEMLNITAARARRSERQAEP